jgi:hypothetical protein
MRGPVRFAALVGQAILTLHLCAAEIVINKEGRTTSFRTDTKADAKITLRVTAPDLAGLAVRYRTVKSVTQPIALETDFSPLTPIPDGKDALFEFPPTTAAEPVILYNVTRHRDASPPPGGDAAADKKIRLQNIKAAEKKLKGLRASLAQTNADIDGFTKSPAEAAVKEIIRLQQERRVTQAAIQDQLDIIENERVGIADDDKKIEELKNSTPADILLKVGVIIQQPATRAIVYSYSDPTPDVPARLDRLSKAPTLTDFDTAYIVVSNIVPSEHPQPFDVSVTWKAGVVVSLTPVRPVLSVPGSGTSQAHAESVQTQPQPQPKPEPPPPLVNEEDAFHDFVAEVESLRFHGGEVPQLTVKTRGLVVATDQIVTEDGTEKTTKTEQVQDIKLLDNADLPQVRTHFRYNFTTGIAVSSLRDPSFQKVVTSADDPKTPDKVDPLYRIERSRGNRNVNGFLGLTYYIHPIDPLRPLNLAEVLIPNPTIGFGLVQPTENVFLGFSNEIVRNTQLVWGIHYGKVSELVNRNDVAEPTDATAPLTRKRFHAKPFLGLTLNLKFLDKVFGR